jgi:phage-related protein
MRLIDLETSYSILLDENIYRLHHLCKVRTDKTPWEETNM